MSPAKKKTTAKPPPKVVPIPPAAIPVPAPVLSTTEKRFWKVVQTKNLIGGTMFLLGIGFCVGFWFSDRVHGFEKWALGVGLFLIILGAHFLSSAPTEAALKSIGSAVKDVIPFTKKSDPPGGGQ